MKAVETSIHIKAAPEAVWNTLCDFNRWADWNPIIYRAAGEAELGGEVGVVMRGKDGNAANKYKAIISRFDNNGNLSWSAKMVAGFLFTNEKHLVLVHDEEGTLLRHSETFEGLLVPLFWGKMETGVKQMLESMNEALKQTLE